VPRRMIRRGGWLEKQSLQRCPRGLVFMRPRIRTKPHFRVATTCLGIVAATASVLWPATPPQTGQASDQQEIKTRESQPSFRLQVQRNLVLVRVVVRDAKGRPVANLRKEDFRVSDNRRPQVITQFSAESRAVPAAKPATATPQTVEPEETGATATASPTPQRFLALFFDDLNLGFQDLVQGRDAADRFLAANLAASDRAGVFTSSGLDTLDFTGDRAKLHEALFKLRPNPRVNPRSDCPEISDYQAERIVNYEDPDAIVVAVDEAVNRCHEDPRGAEQQVLAYARRAYGQYETQAHMALQSIEQLVRRLAAAPGQRNLIVVSGGFLPLSLQSMVGEIADRALRSSVIINSLDPRGLPVLLREADASREYSPSGPAMGAIHALDSARETAASAILAQLPEDTGGEYFHNNNDLGAGFQKVAVLPEVYYVLAFTPQNLKYDGSFHNLKVTLTDSHGYSIRARRGYFAPRKLLDAEAQAKEEVESAAFSQDEMKELPIELHTQFFKTSNGEAELSVLAHLDIHSVRFRKEEQRNSNELTFVTAIFDRDGHFVAGKERRVDLRLRDATLERLLASGLTTRITFTLKPGTYMVRQVVRDSEEGHLAALSQTVEIPY